MSDKARLIDAEKLKQKLIEGDGDDESTEGYNAAMREWISVNDRLPDKDGRYLVCGDIHLWDIEKYRTNECVVIARFTERNEWLTSLSVKYWMFLPELPSEDDAE